MKLDSEPDVLRLADELALDCGDRPVRAITDFCSERIAEWLSRHPEVETIVQLEELVCAELGLKFEEAWTDDDLDRIGRAYAGQGEPIFLHLAQECDDETFGTLVELQRPLVGTQIRYVAVIDCRGEKAARRFFTRWHEIAHLLTMRRLYEFPFHRSTVKRDPLERLMDEIAGQIGFFEALFRPILSRELSAGYLSLAGIDRVRTEFCPHASFQATLIACVARTPSPLLSLEAGMGYKTSELALVRSRQKPLFAIDRPEPKLRALLAAGNDAARTARLRIDRNMEIPEDSIVFSAFHGQDVAPGQTKIGRESLSLWKHSDGSALGVFDVHIEARRVRDRVLAIVRPAEDLAPRRRNQR